MTKTLAEDAFYCAVYYQTNPRVVRRALRVFLSHSLSAKPFAHVAAAYWQWANEHSSPDLERARSLVNDARLMLGSLDPLTRRSLLRMLSKTT